MGIWVVEQLVLEMARRGLIIAETEVLIMGLTFKEDCPDIRNTRVIDVINAMKNYGIKPVVVDPWADSVEVCNELDIKLHLSVPKAKTFAAILVAVGHNQFKQLNSVDWRSWIQPNGIFFDLKGIIPRDLNPIRL